MKYDNETGKRWQWNYGPGVFGSESVFAPRRGATASTAEDDGYVITLVTDSNTWQSDCLIFDARDIEAGPVARVRMPQRVPYGFHATWARGEDLWRASQ